MGVIINGSMNIGSGGISINLQPSDNNITINTYCRVNQNGSININTDPTFPQPLPSPDPNFLCVSGAGSPEINGTYAYLDDYTYPLFGTRPRYQNNSTGIQILAAPGFAGDFYRWFFYYFDGDASTYWYRGNTNPAPAYPWLETSWDIYYGVAPVPTVIIGQC